ncbi:hypothetical protein [Micavibrio aeruginosavorus]|uniref:hypothetical protein n=1 Tax=Micavibrio aeruginosavorus TaxID=349221 RepID=UPI003F4AEA2C
MKKLSPIFAAVAALATVPVMAAEATAEATAPATVPSAHIEAMTRLVRDYRFFHHHGQSARDILAWRVQLNGFSAAAIPPMIDDESYRDIEKSPYIRDFKILSTSAIPDPDLRTSDAATLAPIWAASDTVTMAATGNMGNYVCTDKKQTVDEWRLLFWQRITPYTFADSFMKVGAAELDGTISCYSSENAPDLLYPQGYAQGFCNDYYMSQNEIDAMRKTVRFSTMTPRERMMGDRLFVAHPDAGKQVCNIEGTSFSAPNVNGHLTTLRTQFPDATDMDTYITALLAASQDTLHIAPDQDADYFNTHSATNARGLHYNMISGFGLYDPARHAQLLQTMKTSGQSLSTRFIQAAKGAVNEPDGADRTITFHVNENAAAVRTIVEFRLIPHSTSKDDILEQGLPTHVTLVSPSGTAMRLPVATEPLSLSDADGYRMAVAAPAFLGEKTDGVWTLRLPRGEFHTPKIGHAALYIWGTDNATLNRLIPAGP